MKRSALIWIGAGLLAFGCKSEKATSSTTGSGSAAVGSGSAPNLAGSGSATGPSSELTAPHDVPLTGEALAKHHAECIAGINTGKLDEMKQHCVHADVVVHEMDYDDFKGVDELASYVTEMRAAVPDWKLSPQLVLVSGRNILAVNLVTGTQSGPLKLHDGTERKASNKPIGLLVFQHQLTDPDNKIVEQWEYMDHHTLADQFGVSHEGGTSRAALDKSWPDAPIVLVSKEDAAEQANLDLAKRTVDAFNARKPAEVAAMYADDAVESDQSNHQDHRGKADIEKSLKELFAAFPDAKASITYSFASGDYVVVEGQLTGTHKGPLGTMSATNKPITTSFAEVMQIKNGKIAQLWRFRDAMALIAQLEAPKK